MVMITGGSGTVSGGSGQGGATAVANMADDGTGHGTYKVASISITNPGDYTVLPTAVTLTGGGAATLASGLTISTSANVGGGLTKVGGGTLTLSGSNSYFGGTTVESGVLKMANLAALGTGGLVAAGGTLDLDGNSPTVAGLSGAAGVITNSFSGLETLTVKQPAGASSFSGTIANGAGNGTHQVCAVLSGSGRLVLSGTNTFTGGTEVLGHAALVLASPSALASGSNLIVGSSSAFSLVQAASLGEVVSGGPSTAVPESGTLALTAASGFLIAAVRRWRRLSKRYRVAPAASQLSDRF